MSTLRHFHAKMTVSQCLTGSLHLRKGFRHTPQLVTIKTVGPPRFRLSNRQNYYDVLQCEYATAANKIISYHNQLVGLLLTLIAWAAGVCKPPQGQSNNS